MDISFWLTTPVDLSNGLDRPMGGAEVSAVQLAQALVQTGWPITIHCNTDKQYSPIDGLMVKSYTAIRDDELDTLIVVRAHEILNTRIRAWFRERPRILLNWSGDAFDQPNNHIFWDKWICEHLDGFVVKSKWQRDTLNEMYPGLQGKTTVIKNGVDPSLFPDDVEKDENKFIWASTWYRGLENMIKIWPRIKAELPDAYLDVYAKTSLYLDNNPSDIQAKPIFDALEKLDGINIHEPVQQERLLSELASAKLLLYPNSNFVESSCGVAQQSICAGTPVITSHRAGLPETVGSEGICIQEEPGTDAYNEHFVTRTLDLCRNQKLYDRLSRQGLSRRTEESWAKTALSWTRYLKSL